MHLLLGRACWSLGNAHAAMANHEKALYFATKHLEISKEVCFSLNIFIKANIIVPTITVVYIYKKEVLFIYMCFSITFKQV